MRALHHACSNSHEGCIALLLERGADPNAVDEFGEDSSCLKPGGQKYAVSIIREVIDCIACAVHESFSGNTSLHYAACRGVLNIIMRLLANGAQPGIANIQGSTPLHKACVFGQDAVVKKLVE